MMWGKVSKADAIMDLKTVYRNIEGIYLHGWSKQKDLQMEVIVRSLAEAVERLGGYDALVEVFGPRKEAKVKVDFSEIIKLKDMLDEAEIPHVYINMDDPDTGFTGRRIVYPSFDSFDELVSDAVVSYCAVKEGKDPDEVFNALSVGAPLLEQAGLVEGIVVGGRTAEQVFQSWKADYDSQPDAE